MKRQRQSSKRRTVMVFGTFDILHPGHLYFLRQARRLGDRLVVSVARDSNVRKYKGSAPTFSERDRQKLVGAVREVDHAVLGGTRRYLPHILKQKPAVIALGYDQAAFVADLERDIAEQNLAVRVVRLRAYRPARYKSARYKRLIQGQHESRH